MFRRLPHAILVALLFAASPAIAAEDDAEESAEEADKDEDSNEKDEESQKEEAKKDEKSEEEKGDGDADAVAAKKASLPKVDRRQTSGLGFQLSLGGLAAFRRMRLSGTTDAIDHEPGFYLGAALRGSQLIYSWSETKSHFMVDAEAGFGSARDTQVEPALGRPLVTEHSFLFVTGVFEKPLLADLDLRIGLGAGALSFTIEANPDYTGHRYLSLVGHFGVLKWTDGPFRYGGGISVFPGLRTDQSDGKYGSARSFGARGELHGTWRFYQPEEDDLFGTAELVGRYTYARFRSTYPETQLVGDRVGSRDDQHTLTVFLAYHL